MIDIRELRINSTVLFNGKRVKVEGVVIQNGIVFFENDNAYADMLDPIPITEELLKELMPKDGKSEHCGDIHSIVWDFGEYHIVFTFFGEINVVEISRKEENHFMVQVCNIEHLHELEAFVYLTTKQELI